MSLVEQAIGSFEQQEAERIQKEQETRRAALLAVIRASGGKPKKGDLEAIQAAIAAGLLNAEQLRRMEENLATLAEAEASYAQYHNLHRAANEARDLLNAFNLKCNQDRAVFIKDVHEAEARAAEAIGAQGIASMARRELGDEVVELRSSLGLEVKPEPPKVVEPTPEELQQIKQDRMEMIRRGFVKDATQEERDQIEREDREHIESTGGRIQRR